MSNLKAYHCFHDYVEHHEIYFEKTNISARKAFALEHLDGDLAGITCRHIKWADKFAPGPVPAAALINDGWWWECYSCSDPVDSYNQDPVFEDKTTVFCSTKCHDAYYANKRRVKIIEEFALKAFKKKLVDKLNGYQPDIKHEHIYVQRNNGRLSVKQIVIEFNFPTQKYGSALYRIDQRKEEPHFSCCVGDKEAFRSWISSLKKEEVNHV